MGSGTNVARRYWVLLRLATDSVRSFSRQLINFSVAQNRANN